MNHFKTHIFAVLLILVCVSCNKVIDLKLGNEAGKLVIEANVTDSHGFQSVRLKRNVPFTSTNSYPPVTGATVTVSDGTTSYAFIERAPGAYFPNRMAGFPGVTYTLTVVTDGRTYTAHSTMPPRVDLDSITGAKSVFNNSKNLREISVHFHDPGGIPNQYNFLMFVNSAQVRNVFAYDDRFTNGRDVAIDLVENDVDIHPGDTIGVEMQCIDKAMYTYWFTLMQQGNNFGQGITPSNPPTNITPVTLGYFSAHTSQGKAFIAR